MVGYKIVLHGMDQQVQRYNKMAGDVPPGLEQAMGEATKMLQAHVMEQKLLGQVLHRRTGNLLRNIRQSVEVGSNRQVIGRVFVAAGAPYGRIHEYGGTIQIPEIFPVKAKALRFMIDGHVVFAKRVRAHSVVMPPRSFLRSTLRERLDDARRIFQTWLNELAGS